MRIVTSSLTSVPPLMTTAVTPVPLNVTAVAPVKPVPAIVPAIVALKQLPWE
jgi:hypothetical protein